MNSAGTVSVWRLFPPAVAFVLALFSSPTLGVIYKTVHPDGTISYTDRPPEGTAPVSVVSDLDVAASPALDTGALDELVAPIALYPDELLAVLLPASTYPLQLVQASRYLLKREKNPDLEPDRSWDTSVLALLNYPDVIDKLNQDLDWTWKLGEAVVDQQEAVLDAIQQFRARVDTAGNLESDDKQTVSNDEGVIIIESADPEYIYVPDYDPIVVAHEVDDSWEYSYYAPYPVYYNPRAVFWTGMFVGGAIGYGFDWRNRDIDVRTDIDVDLGGDNINVGDRPRPGEDLGDRVGDKLGDRKPGQGELGDRLADRQPGERRPAGERLGDGGKHTWRPDNRPGASPGKRPVTRPISLPNTRPSKRISGDGNRAAKPKHAAQRPQKRKQKRLGAKPQKRRSSYGGYKRGSQAKKHRKRGTTSRNRTRAHKQSRSRSHKAKRKSYGGYKKANRSKAHSKRGGRSRGGGRRRR